MASLFPVPVAPRRSPITSLDDSAGGRVETTQKPARVSKRSPARVGTHDHLERGLSSPEPWVDSTGRDQWGKGPGGKGPGGKGPHLHAEAGACDGWGVRGGRCARGAAHEAVAEQLAHGGSQRQLQNQNTTVEVYDKIINGVEFGVQYGDWTNDKAPCGPSHIPCSSTSQSEPENPHIDSNPIGASNYAW